MIEVWIETSDETSTGRCWFCGLRLDEPERIQAVAYVEGQQAEGLACPDCLAASDDELRARMRTWAEALAAWAVEVREAAAGPIRRPAGGVLDLERLYR